MSRKRRKNNSTQESVVVPEIVTAAFALKDGESDVRELSNQDMNDVMTYALAQRYRNSIRVARGRMPFGLNYSKDLIFKWLKDPWRYEHKLRKVSEFMYNANGQYKRLCNYQADMVKMSYILIPLLVSVEDMLTEKYVDAYRNTAFMLDCMNIRTEFNKVLRVVARKGVAFAYARSSKDTFSLFVLDNDFCRISSIDGSGCIRFEFNFSFFDRMCEEDRNSYLESYGNEFIEKYNKYAESKYNFMWQEIGENGACFKFCEDTLEYSLPPFIAVLDNLFDLDDYRKLAKAREETGNYNLLNFTVPSNKDGKILMDLQLIKRFIEQVTSEIPDTIGVIYTPMETDKISFAKDTTVNDRNAVTEAVEQFWAAAGVSDLLFGSGKSSANALNKSIIADEINIYPVVRQIERWINRRLRLIRGNYKFKIKILDVTSFNESDVYDMFSKAGSSGIPVKNAMAAILGYTPYDSLAMSMLENNVLHMRDEMFNEPTVSSNTMASEDNTGGRPEMNDDDLSDEGEATRVNERNIRE